MIYNIDTVLIINHFSLLDRLEFQLNQCKKYNLSYQIIEAIDVNDSTGFTNRNIKSCFLSHIKALEKASIINNNCLILEDDASIVDIDQINEYMKNIEILNFPWDMIYMYPSTCPGNIVEIINSKIIKNTITLDAHAYIVKPEIIPGLVENLKNHVKKMELIKNKQSSRSHYDHVLLNQFHKNMKIYSPFDHLIFQYRKKFGSSLNWGLVAADGTKYPNIVEN